MTSLYVCYQGILEPLTYTQVVAYLEGLSLAGYPVVLLTFEPRALRPGEARDLRAKLAAKGITWYWTRYHKWPSLPATLFDIVVGTAIGTRLAVKHKVRLIHARGHVAGAMALGVKRFTGAKLLFDIRGFLAEEYVDAGTWPAGGLNYRLTKRAERALVNASDGYVVLTAPAKGMLYAWYPDSAPHRPLVIIPTCVDLRRIPPPEQQRQSAPVITYVGKLGGWYLNEEMCAFVAAAAEAVPGLQWDIWTQSSPELLRRQVEQYGLAERTRIGRVAPEALGAELSKARAALSFIRPTLSKRASSPTKVGEYLAAGLAVVSNAGVGDVDEVLTDDGGALGGEVGVLISEFTDDAYQTAARELITLLADPATPGRCRRAAQVHLDLERVGWVRYRRIYEELLG